MCTTSSRNSLGKTQTSTYASHAWSRLSLGGLAVICGLIVLYACSCSVRHKTQTSAHSSDSVRERLEITPHPVTLPEERAEMTLLMQTLTTLPDGAGYHTRQGRTSLHIKRRGDSISINAHTDSFTVMPTLTTHQRVEHKTSVATTKQETETKGGIPSALANNLPLLISIIIVIIILISWHKIQSYLSRTKR